MEIKLKLFIVLLLIYFFFFFFFFYFFIFIIIIIYIKSNITIFIFIIEPRDLLIEKLNYPICQNFFKNGFCSYGLNCKFSHVPYFPTLQGY